MNDFTIRHYNPLLDLALLSAMLTEIEAIDRDGEETSDEYLLASLEWPNYRPDQDVWVAELDGRLVGYAIALEQPSQRCTLYVVVHQSQRRNGLGSRMLELVLARARELGSKTILIYANEQNSGSKLFLKHHGFSLVGSSGLMKAPASNEIPPFEFSDGFTLKKYSDVNDTRVLLSALNNCYAGMWGHQHNVNPTEEELQSPQFLKYYDAENILLLFNAENSVCGICSVKPEGKKEKDGSSSDLLDAPGVIKEYRELGHQRLLVLAGIEHLRRNGNRPIALEFWGDSEAALNIYRSLGFQMTYHYFAYHKELE